MRLGILSSHPIQYQAPWFRALAMEVDLEVLFAHRQSANEQAKAGFGVTFNWDVDLLSGYRHTFLKNISAQPGVSHYGGCDTPEISDVICQQPKRFDAFIVNGWYLKSCIQAARACRLNNIPVFVRGDSQLGTPRSFLKRWLMSMRQPLLLRQFDGFLSVGRRNREYLEYFGVPHHRIFFVPHFVDNEWFAVRAQAARSQRSWLRRAWGADDRTFVILFVGKFQPIKRPRDILAALAEFRARNNDLRWVAVFVGAGELLESLRHFADRNGVAAHFEGFKNQTELPQYYSAADVLVLPSESETWGLVVNEGMACGLPAIISDAVGCAPDLIDEGTTGFTFPVKNVPSLARVLAMFAEKRIAGFEFKEALWSKMQVYSLSAAVKRTLLAVKDCNR